MSVLFRPRAIVLVTFASSALVAYAFGQPGQSFQPPQPGQVGQPVQPPSQQPSISGQTQRMGASDSQQRRPGEASQEVERFIAQCLITKNQGEVELAQFAAQRSQNPQVKQFAQILIQDHQAAIQRLQGIAGPQAATQQDRNIRPAGFTGQESSQPSSASNQPGRDRIDASDRTRNEGRVATGPSGTIQAGSGSAALQELATIERQVAERCQQALREKLQSKQGAEFDHCFVGAQVMGHIHMLAQLEVLQQETSGQLREIAQESQPKVKRHLEQAEQLAEQLMDGSNRQAGAQLTSPPSQR